VTRLITGALDRITVLRRSIWPDLPGRIVYEDDALVAVDKPAGVPSQASREGAEDDVVARLRRHLAARDGVPLDKAYLGVHQRLDRATSGVLLYAKRREANRGLAEQFEGRKVEKTYVAAVTGWAASKEKATLEHWLVPGEDGRMEVLPPGRRDRKAVRAVTHVTLLRAGSAGRALLSLELETGRTHQARAQLAAAGAPIAGDRVYGEQPAEGEAPRLLLHARALSLLHPLTGAKLRVEAELPRAFERWLSHGARSPFASAGAAASLPTLDRAALDDALAIARESRFALGRGAEDALPTTVFRLVNEAGDGVPGLAVDVYGEHLVAHFYDDDALANRDAILDTLDGLGFAGIYVKIRPKQANELVDTRTEALAPKTPSRGREAPEEIVVYEHGVPYLARLGDGLSTGIFLDQRENRRRVAELARGKRLLNLFAYTCPFTVAAAAAGAAHTVSVDASRGALDRAERGLVLAGAAGPHHEMVCEDVFAWLEHASKATTTAGAKGARGAKGSKSAKDRDGFDVVILDPPSYSSVGASRFSTASDYRGLAAEAMRVVAKDGWLVACSNHRQTVQAKLRRWLHEAAREAGREVTQMKDLPPPIDFPPPWGREPHLKSVVVRLA
jgi:23S rRNA (cytosine1962-C5)-methyltransferase